MTVDLIRDACARYEVDRAVTDDMRFARQMLYLHSRASRSGWAISRAEYQYWRDRSGWTNEELNDVLGDGNDLVERSRRSVGREWERQRRAVDRQALTDLAGRLWS